VTKVHPGEDGEDTSWPGEYKKQWYKRLEGIHWESRGGWLDSHTTFTVKYRI